MKFRSSLAAVLLAGATPSLAAPATHGIDLAGMDKKVAPGDDFFSYANGGWLKKTEIPKDRSVYGVFSALDEEANQRTQKLIEDTAKAKAKAGTDEQKIGDFYASFLDTKAIEAKGLAPVDLTLKAIAAISDRTGLARLFGGQLRTDVDPLNMTNFHTDHLFGLWVAQALGDPDHYAPYLLQGGLGLPDRDFYLKDDARMKDIRAKYQGYIAHVLELGGVPKPADQAQRVLELETKIAKVHWPRVDSEDVLKANNPWKRDEFPTKAPGLDWPAFFQAAGLSEQPVVMVWQASAIAGISRLVASEPLDAWKAYLTFHAIDHNAAVLPKKFDDARFAFFGKVLSGQPEQRARWKRAVSATNWALGDAVGKIYVKRYFPPEAKAKAQEMVKNIIAAFGKRIDALSWMADATKQKAKEKLSTLIVGVGYPDKWRDYSALTVDRADAYGNMERAERFDYQRNLKKLGQPVDRAEWVLYPQTVNAVNMPLQNALNFPAVIMRPPFYDPQAPMVVNYGAIGSVIGHEISHSFDDQGSQFDASGKLTNWWTKEDLEHFKAASERLAKQFDEYAPFPDAHVNGKLTLSENLADVAGVSAAYDGYRASYGGKEAPKAQGLSGDEQFFLGFGQVWRTKYREPALRQLMLTDGHAPAMYRASTVRNLDAWYPAFGAKEGEKLFLAPADRVRVW